MPVFFVLQPVKPKLSRKITSSARLNLNRYWSKFEELLSPDKHPFGYAAAGLTNGAVNNQLITTDLTNEINENLANELRENNNGRCRNCAAVDFFHLQS